MEILENVDDWRRQFASGWLKHLNETGEVDWGKYHHPRNTYCPDGKSIVLKESRLLLVTSSGAFLKRSQKPFNSDDPLGDDSFRTFPVQTTSEELDYTHGHYDESMVRQDMQVGIPLEHLRSLASEGVIGSLTDAVVSFMGYQPDSAAVAEDFAPKLVAQAKDQGATAALFAPM